MRIKSVTVRNYRVHRDLTVHFDDSLTLIGGVNESGKSTLVEALHRALFLKSKVSGDVQRSMVSTSFTGLPEVEVNFTARASDYRVIKRFSGNTGTTRLVQVGGETWHGEDAEARLALLLKVDAIGGGRGVGERVAQQWSHLWIWQGLSGSDPSEHANQQKDDLLRRLQQMGGAAAMQSVKDAQVATHFSEAKEAIFTLAGKPKTGSDLEKAENEARQAETNRQNAAERVEKLRHAVRDFEETTQTIARVTEDRNKLNLQKHVLEANLARVNELKKQEAVQNPAAQTAAKTFESLKKSDAQISELRGKHQALESALLPKNEETQRLAAALNGAKQYSGEAMQAYDTATTRTRDARLRRDVAAACVTRFEKDARLQELLAKETQVRGYQEQLTRLREELAKVPEVTAPKLKKLQKLELEVNQAEAALNAMAAGIEVLSTSESVHVGGISLAVGKCQVITEQTEIVVGESLSLRISPGGGTSLQEARNQAQESGRNLCNELDAIGIASVPDAADALACRNDLSGKIENTESTLQEFDAANLSEILASAREACSSADAEVRRRATQIAHFTLPTTAVEAKQWIGVEESALEKAGSDEAQAKCFRDAAVNSLAAAESGHLLHRQALDQQNFDLTGLKAQLRLLIETHGEDVTRTGKLAEALSAKNSADALLSSTRQALAELQPDLLEADQNRLKRALELTEKTENEAQIRRGVAQLTLRMDGTDDPEASLELATAHVQSAQDHLASVRRKAEAIRLINQLFLEEQRTLADQFTKPFAERISNYLQCLFRSGARATVTLADNGFSGLQLVRPVQGGGATPFDSLSGGAREQVAAAVRIAMAEVLAPDHDGCLPLVFDDSFAYSDPERVQILQRMLDLAASRGLQIIILTCNQSDYAALGAHQITIQPERTTFPIQQLPSAADSTKSLGEAEGQETATKAKVANTTCTEEQRSQFIASLRELGGKAGNLSLRETLGWDDPTYTMVKDNLIADGSLLSGKSRGGSVALPDV